MAGFSYNYKPIDYKTAQGQVAGQIDPLFNRAIQGVNQQKYQSDVQAGQVSAARGLGHSGLAADQLNKIAIATQGQVGDLNAQRATQIAQQANDLVWRDKEFGLQDRAQKYSEYNSDRGYNYQVGRDKIGDQRYNTEWNYNVGRDKVADQRYNSETAYNHQRDANDDAWRQKEWSQMSPAEKARMAYAKKLGSGGGGGGGGGRRSSGRRSSSSSSGSTGSARNRTNQSTQSRSALDTYYSSPAIQAAEKAKMKNPDARKYFKSPTPPAQSPYLSAWEKKKMLGL